MVREVMEHGVGGGVGRGHLHHGQRGLQGHGGVAGACLDEAILHRYSIAGTSRAAAQTDVRLHKTKFNQSQKQVTFKPGTPNTTVA